MGALKVGELYAELGLKDDLTKPMEKAEAKFKSTAQGMDAEAKIDLDTSRMMRKLDQMEREVKQTTASIDDEAPTIDGSKLDDGVRRGMDNVDEVVSSGMGEMGDVLSGGMVGIGAAGAAALLAGFDQAFDRQALTAKLGTRMGLSPEFAKGAGKVAGDLYVQGWGDSVADVGSTVEAVSNSLGGVGAVGADEFKQTTKNAMALSDALDQDVMPAAARLVKTGMAKDLNQAMDMILIGFQRGGKGADDFVDTLDSKAGVFKEFGLTGTQAIGAVLQTLDKGAPSADFFSGALEELKGNAGESADIFWQLGLNGAQMSRDLSAGGPPAAAALTLLLQKLRDVKDPAQLSGYFVGLFGEEATAMQSALLAVDPSQATGRLGEFEGAAKRAADAVPENPFENFKRGASENLVNFINNSAIPALDGLSTKFHEVFGEQAGDNLRNGAQVLGSGPGGTAWAEGVMMATPMGPLMKSLGWFDDGGVVGGPIGSPQLAVVHGGETISDTHKTRPSSPTGMRTGGMGGRRGRDVTVVKVGTAELARVERKHDKAWS